MKISRERLLAEGQNTGFRPEILKGRSSAEPTGTLPRTPLLEATPRTEGRNSSQPFLARPAASVRGHRPELHRSRRAGYDARRTAQGRSSVRGSLFAREPKGGPAACRPVCAFALSYAINSLLQGGIRRFSREQFKGT